MDVSASRMNFHGKPIRARLIRDVSETYQGFTAGLKIGLVWMTMRKIVLAYCRILRCSVLSSLIRPINRIRRRCDRRGVNTGMALALRCTPLLTLILSCPDIETCWYLPLIFGLKRFDTLRGKVSHS